MTLHPFDLAAVVRGDLVLADVLLGRIEHGQGAREMLVAELVASLSIHVAASNAVVVAAVDKHLAPADDLLAAIIDDNRRLSGLLLVTEESTGPEADAAIVALRECVGRRLAETEPANGGENAVFRQIRTAVGDAGMLALGNEFAGAKRQASEHSQQASIQPNFKGAISRIVGAIDRVIDPAAARAARGSSDGSGILNEEAQRVIDALAELGRMPTEILEPEQARRQPAPIDASNLVLQQRDEDIVPPFVARLDDTTIAAESGKLPVRIYDAKPDPARLKPVVLYIHGGGWVLADIYAYDASPRGLALLIDAVVVSVEYRRAPEHRFPAAHDDVLAAVRWLQHHAEEVGGDARRIALVGENSGGNMAAAASIGLIRANQPLPLAQVLICPVTSLREDWPSYREHVDAKPLSTAMIGWNIGHLLSDPADADDRLDLLAAPDADLAKMPPTLVIIAERDPLHDQGVAFAERLKQLGVATAIREYKGVPHEFFGMARVLADARDAQAATATLLLSVFAEQP